MVVVVLNDRDPSITYSGTWRNGGNPGAEYQGTTTFSSAGPNVFGTLNFTSTGVTVLGTVSTDMVQMSSYSIDGGPSMMYTSSNSSNTLYSQPFFNMGAGSFSPGVMHQLVITPVQGDLFLDFITIDAPSPANANTGNTGTYVATTTIVVSASATSTLPVLSTSGSSNQSRAKVRLGHLIIGAMLGGIALALCVLFLTLAYVKRQRKAVKTNPGFVVVIALEAQTHMSHLIDIHGDGVDFDGG